MEERWTDPDWLASAVAWIDERLAAAGRRRTADADQGHVRPWSTVIRVPTEAGAVWFKANAPELRDLSRWDDVVEGAADIARAMEPDVDELIAAGVPDLRLAALPDRYDALVAVDGVDKWFREAAPRVREMAEELASYGVTETLQHDDLHDGQVFVRDDRQLILDWGDAVISHPFFTLSTTWRTLWTSGR